MARGDPSASGHHRGARAKCAGVSVARRGRSGARIPGMTDQRFTTAAEIAHKVAEGNLFASDVIDATLERIVERDSGYNCFTTVTAERARARADAIDAARQAGQNVGPLAGVPFAV